MPRTPEELRESRKETGMKLRSIRQSQRIKVSVLASRVGAKAHHLSNVECGHSGLSRDLAAKLADALGCAPSDFFEGAVDAAETFTTQAPSGRDAYTTEEAGWRLGGVSEASMRNAIERGEIAAFKLGGRWLIPHTEIARLLASAEQKSA